jgi:hypothetical protein
MNDAMLPALVEDHLDGAQAQSTNASAHDPWNLLHQAPSSSSLAGWQQRMIAMSTKYSVMGGSDGQWHKYGLQTASTEALLYTQRATNESLAGSHGPLISTRQRAGKLNQVGRRKRQQQTLACELAASLAQQALIANQYQAPTTLRDTPQNDGSPQVIRVTTRQVQRYRVGQAFFQTLNNGSIVRGTIQRILMRAQPPHVLLIEPSVPMPKGQQQVLAYAFYASLHAAQALDERFEVALADAESSLRSVERHVNKLSELKRACPFASASQVGQAVDDDLPDPDCRVKSVRIRRSAGGGGGELSSASGVHVPKSTASHSPYIEDGSPPLDLPVSRCAPDIRSADGIESEWGEKSSNRGEADQDLEWVTEQPVRDIEIQRRDVDLFADLMGRFAPMDPCLFRVARFPGRALLRLLTINTSKISRWWLKVYARVSKLRHRAAICMQQVWRGKDARHRVELQRARAKRARAFARRVLQAEKHQCFRKWQDAVKRNKMLRERLGLRRHAVIAATFEQWENVVIRTRKARLELQQRHQRRWQRKRLETSFFTLDEHRASCQRVKGIMRRLLLRNLAKVFDGWAGIIIDKRIALESYATEVQRLFRGFRVRLCLFKEHEKANSAMEVVAIWGQKRARGHAVRSQFRRVKALCLERKRGVTRLRRRKARRKAKAISKASAAQGKQVRSLDQEANTVPSSTQARVKVRRVISPQALEHLTGLGIRLDGNGELSQEQVVELPMGQVWQSVRRERGIFAGIKAIRDEKKRTVEFLTTPQEVLCPRCRKVVRIRKLEHLKTHCAAESALVVGDTLSTT